MVHEEVPHGVGNHQEGVGAGSVLVHRLAELEVQRLQQRLAHHGEVAEARADRGAPGQQHEAFLLHGEVEGS
eukprot:16444811-Heterocapsa_arctica.AAC.1